MYLRPFHFSMESSLGVKSPSTSQIMIISSPVGPYYPTGFNPISLLCETHHIRSAPGGTGGFKLGGYLIYYLETMAQPLPSETKHKRKAINKFFGSGIIKSVKLAVLTYSLSSPTKKPKREKSSPQPSKILFFQVSLAIQSS